MKDLYALFRQSLAGLRVLLAATLLLGVAYPLVVYGVAAGRRALAGRRARWSPPTGEHTTDADDAVGSALIGQLVDDRRPVPAAAVGRRRRLRHARVVRLQPRPGEPATSSRRSRSARPRSPSARASTRATYRRTRSPRPAPGSTPTSRVAYADLQVPRVAEANGLTEDAGPRPGRRAHLGPRPGASSASRASTCWCSTSRSARQRRTPERHDGRRGPTPRAADRLPRRRARRRQDLRDARRGAPAAATAAPTWSSGFVETHGRGQHRGAARGARGGAAAG